MRIPESSNNNAREHFRRLTRLRHETLVRTGRKKREQERTLPAPLERPACAATHPDPAPPRPTPARPGRIPAASSGRRRCAVPPQALPLPRSAPPAVPAAPEPRDSAVTVQVPAAAFALQVGAAPPRGAPGSRGRLVSAALVLRPSSRRPGAAGRSPPSSDRTSAEASAAGASSGRPRGTSLPGGLGASRERLRARRSQSPRRPTWARALLGRALLERRGARAPGEMGACPRAARRASPAQWGRCPRVLGRAAG